MVQELGDNLFGNLPFSWGAASDVGKVRDENQDAFVIEPEAGLFLVSDGIGGHRGGALASNIVAEDLPVIIETRLGKLKTSSPRAVRSLFKKAIVEQSRQLLLEGTSENGYKGMGATLVMLLLRNSRAYIANLGDSRIYRLRKGRLVQLTKDHSVLYELLSKGKIEPQEIQNHEAQGQITHYVGMEDKVAPYVRMLTLKKADRLLLCTDGLTDMVNDRDITEILKRQTDCQAACDELVDAANAAGGYDNITVLLVDWKSRS